MPENTNLERLIPIYIERFKQNYAELEEKTGRHGKKGSEIRKWLKSEVQSAFSKENIDSLEKDEIVKIISEFYSVERGEKPGGYENERNRKWVEDIYEQDLIPKLKDLLFSEDNIEERFVRFKEIELVKNGIASEILSYFYPDNYAFYNSASKKALTFLGFEYEEVPAKSRDSGRKYIEFCEKVKLILDLLRRDPFFEDADYITADYFLYEVSQSKIWKVAPGESAYLWDQGFWQDKGIVSINWSEIYDELKEDLFTASKSVIKNSADVSDYVVNQHIKFLHEFEIGDIIVANQGKSNFIGYGIITSNPKYLKDYDENTVLCRDVIWLKTDLYIPIPEDEGLIGKCNHTIASLSFDQFRKFVLGKASERKFWIMNPSYFENNNLKNLYFWDQWKDGYYIHMDSWKEFTKEYGEEALSVSDYEEFTKLYNQVYDDNSKSKYLFNFIHSMNEGDLVLINNGKKSIVGEGVISSSTIYDDGSDDEDREGEYFHYVNWIETDLNIPIPENLKGKVSKRIIELTKDEYEEIMNDKGKKPLSKDIAMLEKLLERKKQVILYGPPGTGKTFKAREFIKSNGIPKYTFSKDTLSEYSFFSVTIYEPRDSRVRDLKPGDKFKYIWIDGESNNKRNWQKDYDEIQEGDFAFGYTAVDPKRYTTILKCSQKYNDEYLVFEVIQQFKGPGFNEIKDNPVFNNSILRAGKMSFSLYKLKDEDVKAIISLSDQITPEFLRTIFEPQNKTVNSIQFVTFHPSFGYEDFIEGLRPLNDDEGKICYNIEDGIFKKIAYDAFNILLNKANVDKTWDELTGIPDFSNEEKEKIMEVAPEVPFYLIIDEINRGDISRIFGELITLLESDKRLCAENELTTILPYSKTRFGIPPNLFLIGTMNTADKSIALVDIALRRRFGFLEMMPDSEVLRSLLVSDNDDVQEIYDIAIAVHEYINNKILHKYDRDHQIGHSYFVKLKDKSTPEDACESLEFIWYYEVLPLLQEYFYDSPKKLSEILGKDFVNLSSEGRTFIFTEPCQDQEFLTALKKLTGIEDSQILEEELIEDSNSSLDE